MAAPAEKIIEKIVEVPAKLNIEDKLLMALGLIFVVGCVGFYGFGLGNEENGKPTLH